MAAAGWAFFPGKALAAAMSRPQAPALPIGCVALEMRSSPPSRLRMNLPFGFAVCGFVKVILSYKGLSVAVKTSEKAPFRGRRRRRRAAGLPRKKKFRGHARNHTNTRSKPIHSAEKSVRGRKKRMGREGRRRGKKKKRGKEACARPPTPYTPLPKQMGAGERIPQNT
jgi:hypothetical protein